MWIFHSYVNVDQRVESLVISTDWSEGRMIFTAKNNVAGTCRRTWMSFPAIHRLEVVCNGPMVDEWSTPQNPMRNLWPGATKACDVGVFSENMNNHGGELLFCWIVGYDTWIWYIYIHIYLYIYIYIYIIILYIYYITLYIVSIYILYVCVSHINSLRNVFWLCPTMSLIPFVYVNPITHEDIRPF